MIVRTYGRRSRDLSRSTSFSDPLLGVGPDAESDLDIDADDFAFSFSQSQETQIRSPRDRYSLFSSQDSSPWSLDPDLTADNPRSFKRPSSFKRPRDASEASASAAQPSLSATATLMETQEFGEMMEHVDEVNFALDGLRPGQPARIRRASLLSLLSICGSAQQRRLLRAQGMAKRIVDAILGLKFDDSPSNVAAAALFFVWASDAQDDHLLDSPACIRLLLKLLNPPITGIVEDRTVNIGTKFLGLRRPQMLNDTNKGMDFSSTQIFLKVQEILLSCKEIKSGTENDDGMSRPELSSKWISLLTMEKACLSTVSFEDTSEPVRKVGGNFKERLRELGGLDAVFDVIVSCHSTLERWVNQRPPSYSELKDGSTLESVVFLLKCLKLMENATFLSKDNQDHLLSMRGKLNSVGSPMSFVGVIISAIELLSGFSLQRFPINTSQAQVEENKTGQRGRISTRDIACVENENSHAKSTTAYHKRRKVASSTSDLTISGSEITVSFTSDQSVKNKADGVASDLRDGALSGSSGVKIKSNGLKLNRNANGLEVNTTANSLKVNSGKGACGWISIRTTVSESNSCRSCKRPQTSEEFKGESSKDCDDPFAFDEDDLVPSKWEKLSSKKETTLTVQSTVTNKEHSRGYDIFSIDADLMLNQTTNDDSRSLASNQLSDGEKGQSCYNVCPVEAEEDPNLLEDCLLASVKVLMNLTNDNPIGCQQIAACGGLDTMVSLLVNHFPSYELRPSIHSQLKEDVPSSSQSASGGRLNNKHLTGHGLDLLVAIMGLLVNLVEKDSENRLRLAVARVSVEGSGASEIQDKKKDVIPLLCSIFLENQGAGEAAEEEGRLLLTDDEALTQGEQEAEMMIIEAYAALLLAFLSTDSADVREAIASCLPNHNLEALVPVLERFVAFHLTLNMISPETHSTVTKVIESCKGS